MLITRTSSLSGVTRTKDLNITEDQLTRWENGELIQDVMPYLTPAEREFIISGISEDEWNDMFYLSEEEKEEILSEDITNNYMDINLYKSHDDTPYEIRFKDIDPDTGQVSQDRRVVVVDGKGTAEEMVSNIHKEYMDHEHDPNRIFYFKPYIQ